jgi:DNA gyrase subunit A
MLRHFLELPLRHRRRRFEHQLEKLRERIHILEGFAIVFDALDEAIRIIRSQRRPADAAEKPDGALRPLRDCRWTPSSSCACTASPGSRCSRSGRAGREAARRPSASKRSSASTPSAVRRVRSEMLESSAAPTGTPAARARSCPPPRTRPTDEEAYIVKETPSSIVTRDGWMKRQGSFSGRLEDPGARGTTSDRLGADQGARTTRQTLTFFTQRRQRLRDAGRRRARHHRLRRRRAAASSASPTASGWSA